MSDLPLTAAAAVDRWLLSDAPGDELVFAELTAGQLVTYLRTLTSVVCEPGTPVAACVHAAALADTNVSAAGHALINLAFSTHTALVPDDASAWLADAPRATRAVATAAAQRPGWNLPGLLTYAARRREHL